ncbi:Syntaxin-18, partial [Halocaridina rubra]
SSNTLNGNRENHDEHEADANKEEKNKKVPDEPGGSGKNQMPSSPFEDEMENVLGELSSEERQMLEEENLHLYKELMSNQEEVKQITRQVVELGQMQDFFSEKVDIQAHQIEEIQDTIMAATESVKEGNEQVREAMRNDAGFRVWIMFFLIVMSCTILFLDWYNG